MPRPDLFTCLASEQYRNKQREALTQKFVAVSQKQIKMTRFLIIRKRKVE